MSTLFDISVLSTTSDDGKYLCLQFRESTSFIVFHVFFMSDLYLLKVYTINFRFVARILFRKIVLYVFRLILIILYSIEVGFVDLLSLYSLPISY